MASMVEYSQGCDFILEEFKLPKETNIYSLVATIVQGYKELQDELLIAKAAKPLKKEKKRGRPRKSIS
jgi:hypothetical protein